MRKLTIRLRTAALISAFLIIIAHMGCANGDNPLAPYEGSRPLIVQNVTTSFAPDISWVGGRIAAIGINKGDEAALDSSLVWIYTADGNDLESPLFVREVLESEEVTKYGGTPSDSLEDGEIYTLWLAEKEAFDAALSSGEVDEFSFSDTTFTSSYLLSGRSAGGVDVDFTIVRDQRLLSDEFRVSWSPATQAFRRIAIRNSSVGGFSDLIWHVVLPDSLEDSITSPLVIGQVPGDAVEAVAWEGFGTGQHVLWAATEEWDGESFGFTTDGYAFYSIFAANFE